MQLVSLSAGSVFFALGDFTRLRIVRLLAATGEEACLCEISATLGGAEDNLSRHLKLLRQAGVLSGVKEGRWVYHRFADGSPALADLSRAILAFEDLSESFDRDLVRFKDVKARCMTGRCRGEASAHRHHEEKAG